MFKQKFRAIFVVRIEDSNGRLSEIRQGEKYLLLHFFELSGIHQKLSFLFVVFVAKEAVLSTKIDGEIFIDKGDVGINLSHLEKFFATETELLIPHAALGHVLAFFPLFTKTTFVPSIFNITIKL